MKLIKGAAAISAAACLLLVAPGCGGSSDSTSSSTTSTATEESSAASNSLDQIGATFADASGNDKGIEVTAVADESTRLQKGDVITAINHEPVNSLDDADKAIGNVELGKPVVLSVTRGSKHFRLTIVPSPTGYLGVQVQEVQGKDPGLLVVGLKAGDPAQKAGVELGDVILAIDGTKVETPDDLLSAVAPHQPGDTVTITVARGSHQRDLEATLIANPDA